MDNRGDLMKVFFINSVVDYGSTGKIVRDLSDELIRENHQVKMAYGRHDVKDSRNTISLVNKFGFYYHYFMSRFFGRHGLHSTKETKMLINEIKNFAPDVIHIHNLHGYYLNVPLFLEEIKKMNKKVIITLHDMWLISGSSAYFDYDGCKIWDDGCVVCNNTKEYPQADFIKRQKQNFKWKKESLTGFSNLTFITPSQWLKDVISTSFLRDYPCEVVNNGIDVSIFYEREAKDLREKYKDKKVLLGVASKWETRKGLPDLIKLSSMLDDEYTIVIIGLDKNQIEKLPSNVVGIERTNNAAELAEYYSIAYALLNPTYEDNYPTTNLEARACNTAVVAYDTGGNKEVEGVSIVKQGDLEQMVEEIYKLNDRLESTVDYSKEAFIEKMMKFYE